jgi:hypothetical protein
MPLTTGELDRVKAELGYNVLNTGAQPFIGVHMVFEQVILPYLREGNDTTSSTPVVAATDGAFVTISVASATGIVLHERIAVDVDDFFEMATVRSISATSVGVILKKAHSGTYPVSVDGGLVQVRECLAALYAIQLEMRDDLGGGAIKQVDEVHFYEMKSKRSSLEGLLSKRELWRDELRSRLGIPRRSIQQRCGGSVSLA